MAPTEPHTFGSLLKRYRVAAEMTQAELAERACLSVRGISDLERGVNLTPHRDTVRQIVEALTLDAGDRHALEAAARRRPRVGETEHPKQRPHGNLPPELTPLVGRERAHAEAVHLLRSGVRLLTLTGPGGVGKTRLGLRVASTLATECADGVIFVPLASIVDHTLVAATVASTLDVHADGTRSPADAVIDHLADKDVLLVLDNFEQVIEAATFVRDLLGRCSNLKILVTSREPLHVTGEQESPVEPLELPAEGGYASVDEVLTYPAVALFVQRARATQPGFSIGEPDVPAVVEICRLLDGVPLAIELAAARTRLLSLRSLLAHLGGVPDRHGAPLRLLSGGARDLPDRQKTMYHTIAWSYDLLDSTEQRLFRSLSVFAGGFTIEAASEVVGDDESDSLHVFDGIASLADKSLIVPMTSDDEPRFRMLVTIREFGFERLTATEEADSIRHRHAAWVRDMVERAAREMMTGAVALWFARLETEMPNIRAALAWSRDSGDFEIGLRVVGSLWRFWDARGHGREGRDWTERLLDSAETAGVAPVALADGLNAAGSLAYLQSNFHTALDRWERCLEVRRSLGDQAGIAVTLNGLGCVATDLGDYHRAIELLEQSAAIRRAQGNTLGLAAVINNLANVLRYRGEYARALDLYEESTELHRRVVDMRGVALTLFNRAQVHDEQGDYDRAIELSEESLMLYRESRDHEGANDAMSMLGSIALNRGRLDEAETILSECLAYYRQVGDLGSIATDLTNLGQLALMRGDIDRAEELVTEAMGLRRQVQDKRGLTMTGVVMGDVLRVRGRRTQARQVLDDSLTLARAVGHPWGEARCLEGLARLAMAEERWHAAARLLGEADAIRVATQNPIPPVERDQYDRDLACVRAALGEGAFAEAWAGARERACVP